ncbi:hypothetical protein VKT23_018716 [Stygiomarasmius scandens]|uniref:Thioredoxin domain-containing protein n=1 Tax=Marasmiellus scandens TaxID=2682957 RepID=A0ABR1INR4_9AGAR
MSTSSDLPDQRVIEKVCDLELFDAKGKKIKFNTIIAGKKVIVVFIRHFFCGSCQQYVEQLASVPKEKLEGANIGLVVVGCGDWQPITHYAEETGFKGEIYAEPTRAIYRELGMISNMGGTPQGEERKSYLKRGPLFNALRSIWRGPLSKPSLIGKQGNVAQLGGEFVFEPEKKCTFAYRMKHSEDHVEVVDLMKRAGVDL